MPGVLTPMRYFVALLLLLDASPVASQVPGPPYRGLFARDAKWTLPCVKSEVGRAAAGKRSPDGTLECRVADLRTIGTATLVRVACSNTPVDPSGWYAMIDRGLYHLDRFEVGAGEPPRPRPWIDDRPLGSFRASDVVALRAQRPLMPAKPVDTDWDDAVHPSGWTGGGANFQTAGAWCAAAGGGNGGGDEWRTLCVSEQGLVGARFEKDMAVYRWSCGVLDGS